MSIFADVTHFAAVAESPRWHLEPEKTLQLCFNLIEEEVVKELLPALQKYSSAPSLENLVPVVDGAIDGIYVLAFLLTQMGINGDKMWQIVQQANMAKFPGGKAVLNELGKVQKPVGWIPPEESIFEELVRWNSNNKGQQYHNGMVIQEGEKK